MSPEGFGPRGFFLRLLEIGRMRMSKEISKKATELQDLIRQEWSKLDFLGIDEKISTADWQERTEPFEASFIAASKIIDRFKI
jgi:hypothetical protein